MAAARTLSILLAAVVATAAFASPASSADGDVVALQIALHARGAYDGPIDGVAGPLTERGVRAFQRSSGLGVDGVAGPQTLGALGARALGSRLLERGAGGWDVVALQYALGAHGFPSGTLDGVLGERTEAALVRFQRWAGIAPDGVAGPMTLAALAAPTPAVPIDLVAPVDAPPGDGFGPRGLRFHTGIDYAVASGTPVRAAAAGTVTWAGLFDAGYGVVVVVDHGGDVRSWYAHLSSVAVTPGARVGAGATLGGAGATGAATGPHLHFEVRVRGAAADPRYAVRAAPID